MIDIIKDVVKNYLNAVKPVRLIIGKIENISPLQIRVDQKLVIPGELIIFPPQLNQNDVGKKALIIRQEGGQEYYILEVR